MAFAIVGAEIAQGQEFIAATPSWSRTAASKRSVRPTGCRKAWSAVR